MTTSERHRTLDQVAPLLGHAYGEWKDWEGKKDEYRQQFFDLADEAVKRDGLGLKLYDVYAADMPRARHRAQVHNPGWLIDELRSHRTKAGLWEAILQEDPGFKPYTFEHEGVKYSRQVTRGPVLVDEAYVQERDPELFDEVTFTLPWGEVVVRPLGQLPHETIAKLQKYVYYGRPRVSLRVAPVKEES